MLLRLQRLRAFLRFPPLFSDVLLLRPLFLISDTRHLCLISASSAFAFRLRRLLCDRMELKGRRRPRRRWLWQWRCLRLLRLLQLRFRCL